MTRHKFSHACLHFFPILFFFVLSSVLCAQGFYDDFSDGSATDGNPVTWFPRDGTFTVDANDNLTLHHDPQKGWATATVPDLVLSDTSIRTQVRMVEGDGVGFGGRFVPPGGFQSCYSAGLYADGLVAIGQCGVSGSFLGEKDTDLDPTQEDVMLQFDMIGTTLQLWAWRPIESMPNEALVTVENTTLQSGEVFVSVLGNPSTAEYRFVQVDTKHIPEPSSLVLCFCGFLGLVAFRRHRSF